ncbi:MAG: 50S ribosomal protein L11 methyltransferase [Desulfobaccales bacterium]
MRGFLLIGGLSMFEVVSPELVMVTLGQSGKGRLGPCRLRIRPGGAFPPTHPTARLCLELLEERCSASPPARVLDVGCGSGVLALAAAALGASLVLALDIVAAAVRITRENARENGLSAPVRVAQGSTAGVRGRFDLVLANLPWEVQIAQASEFSRLTAPSGAIILSGFWEYQEHLLGDLYQQLGWSLKQRRLREFRHPELPPHFSFTWAAWLLQRNERSLSF